MNVVTTLYCFCHNRLSPFPVVLTCDSPVARPLLQCKYLFQSHSSPHPLFPIMPCLGCSRTLNQQRHWSPVTTNANKTSGPKAAVLWRHLLCHLLIACPQFKMLLPVVNLSPGPSLCLCTVSVLPTASFLFPLFGVNNKNNDNNYEKKMMMLMSKYLNMNNVRKKILMV